MNTVETRTTTSIDSTGDSTDSTDSTDSILLVSESETASCASVPQHSLDHAQRLVALAERLKAVADPTRLRMLELLTRQNAALCVCEITEQFTLHQPTISHHLRLLRESGLIAGEKRGTWSYYWATDEGKRLLAVAESLA
jgi:ArsR family transcriptional regulator